MTTTPFPPKRRWPKFLLAIGVLLLVIVWFLPVIVAKTPLKNRLITMATKDINGTLTVDSLSLSWVAPVEANGITLIDLQGDTVAQIESLNTEKTLLQLVRNTTQLGQITIVKPVVTIRCDEKITNLETVIDKFISDEESKATKPTLKLVWADGTVTLRDGPSLAETVFTNVVGEAEISDTVKVTTKMGVANPAGSIDVTGEISQGGKFNVTLNTVPTECVGWLARRFEPGLALQGRATGTAAVNWKDASMQANGNLAWEKFEVSSSRTTPERLSSSSISAPFRVSKSGTQITVEQFDAKADFGTFAFVGQVEVAEPIDRWISKPGLKLNADLDIAKVATMLPNTLHMLPGTTIQEGRITANVASLANPNGTTWAGKISTSRIRGIRDGKPLEWDSPITAEFAGRLGADNLPTFDTLTMQSDFVAVNVAGSLEKFEAAASIDLARLKQRLGEFIDLREYQLAGTGVVRAWNRSANGQMNVEITAEMQNVVVQDGKLIDWREPSLQVKAKSILVRDTKEVITAKTGNGTLTAGSDSLAIELLEPIADLRQFQSASANVTLAGDLARWKTRIGPMAGFPAEWQTGGSFQVTAKAKLTDKGLSLDNVDAGGTNVTFRGAGISLNEPAMRIKADAASYQFASSDLLVTQFHLGSESMATDSDRLMIQPGTNPPRAEGKLTISAARLGRIQKTLGWQTDPRGGNLIDGMAKGSITLSSPNGQIGFDANLSAESVRYGLPQKPTWQEAWVRLQSTGTFDLPGDRVSMKSFRVERDGFAVEASGGVTKLSKSMDLELTGQLTYDLAKLEPQVKDYLGKGGQLKGKDTKPFSLAGPLANGVDNLSVAVGSKDLLFPQIGGQAAASWQSVRAYGFDVGAAELKAVAKQGIITFDPIRANFGGGLVTAKPTLKLNPSRFDLSIDRGRIVERARLTPAVCADALGYALPAIANSTEAEGLISIDLDDAIMPLVDYTKMTAHGNMILHTVSVTPGPVVRTILAAVNVSEPKFNLANDQTVKVWIENGRVYHQNLTLVAKNFSLKTSGSVGFDGSMQLNVEMPIPPQLIDQSFKNNPRIRDAMQKRTITVVLGGTVSSPKIDAKALQANLQKMIADAGRDALKDAAGGLLQKELDKNLEKFLPKKP